MTKQGSEQPTLVSRHLGVRFPFSWLIDGAKSPVFRYFKSPCRKYRAASRPNGVPLRVYNKGACSNHPRIFWRKSRLSEKILRILHSLSLRRGSSKCQEKYTLRHSRLPHCRPIKSLPCPTRSGIGRPISRNRPLRPYRHRGRSCHSRQTALGKAGRTQPAGLIALIIPRRHRSRAGACRKRWAANAAGSRSKSAARRRSIRPPTGLWPVDRPDRKYVPAN